MVTRTSSVYCHPTLRLRPRQLAGIAASQLTGNTAKCLFSGGVPLFVALLLLIQSPTANLKGLSAPRGHLKSPGTATGSTASDRNQQQDLASSAQTISSTLAFLYRTARR